MSLCQIGGSGGANAIAPCSLDHIYEISIEVVVKNNIICNDILSHRGGRRRQWKMHQQKPQVRHEVSKSRVVTGFNIHSFIHSFFCGSFLRCSCHANAIIMIITLVYDNNLLIYCELFVYICSEKVLIFKLIRLPYARHALECTRDATHFEMHFRVFLRLLQSNLKIRIWFLVGAGESIQTGTCVYVVFEFGDGHRWWFWPVMKMKVNSMRITVQCTQTYCMFGRKNMHIITLANTRIDRSPTAAIPYRRLLISWRNGSYYYEHHSILDFIIWLCSFDTTIYRMAGFCIFIPMYTSI